MTLASDNIFPKLILAEGSAPSSPSAGDFKLYVDSADHLLKYKNSSGTVTTLGVGMTNPMTTAGDIIYGGASGAPTRLAGGTSTYVLTSNGATSAPSWQAPSGGGSAPTWVANTTFPENYPASADAKDDEFDDSTGMSGSGNGLNARWSWRNQGSATISYTAHPGFATITPPASSTENWRIIEQSIADGTYEADFDIEGRGDRYGGFTLWDGINLDGLFIGLGWESSVAYFFCQRKTSVTSHNNNLASSIQVTYTSVTGDCTPTPTGHRLVRSGTALEYWVRFNHYDWRRIFNVTEDTIPTTIGLGVNDHSNSGTVKMHINSFRKTA